MLFNYRNSQIYLIEFIIQTAMERVLYYQIRFTFNNAHTNPLSSIKCPIILYNHTQRQRGSCFLIPNMAALHHRMAVIGLHRLTLVIVNLQQSQEIKNCMYLCMDVSQRLTRGLYIAQSTATKITYHIVIANRTQDYILSGQCFKNE